MSSLTEFAKRILLEGGTRIGIPDSDNPFVVEDGLTYCKFDSIEIEKDGNDVMSWFCWRGRRIAAVRDEGVYEWGRYIRIGGIQGRQRLYLE